MFALYKDGTGTGLDVRLPLTYNGLTLHSSSSTADDDIRIERLVPSTLLYVSSDRRQGEDGSEVGLPTKVLRAFTIYGVFTAPNQAKLYDKSRQIARTFDPALIARDNPDVRGFLPLDGSLPTDDTVTYPTGLIAARLYARPQATVQPSVIVGQGHAASFIVPMICRDPRAYLQTTESHVIDQTSETVANSKADYPSWPTLTLTATASVDVEYIINNEDDDRDALHLSLDLSDGDVVVVDMERHEITLNSILAPELYLSGEWFDLSAGNNDITVNTVTNLTGSLSWRPAFSL